MTFDLKPGLRRFTGINGSSDDLNVWSWTGDARIIVSSIPWNGLFLVLRAVDVDGHDLYEVLVGGVHGLIHKGLVEMTSVGVEL